MPEQNDLTHLHVQRKLKPKIEDVIPLIVDEDKQQTALDFVAWLCENKMTPGWSGVHNAWDSKYKGKAICKTSLAAGTYGGIKGTWNVKLYLENITKYEKLIIDEGLQNTIWNTFRYCRAECGGRCAPGNDFTFLGKAFKGICNGNVIIGRKDSNNIICSFWIFITIRNETEIAAVKRLIELEKQARTENAEYNKKIKNETKKKVNELANGVKLHENFKNFDSVKCKAAEMLPLYNGQYGSSSDFQFNGIPQILKVCDHDGAKCLYIETAETPRNKRRGFLVAEDIKMDGELTIEVKVKPIDGIDGIFELWLLGDTGEHFCLTLDSSGKEKFAFFAMRCQMENDKLCNSVYGLGQKFKLNEWYYLHIQLRKDKIKMAMLDANRVLIDRRTFDTPAGFGKFDIAFAHSVATRTKEEYYYKTYVESVIVADCDCRDLGE